MIYYITMDNPHPSGGVKTQYRHVEILNKYGYDAAMLHQVPGFRSSTWFESTAPIRYNGQVDITSNDVLVWPEILRSSILGAPNKSKNVIFNQNVHYTWRGSMANPNEKFNYANGALGTMVLTEYERDFLSNACPRHHIGVVRHGIDPSIFSYDGREKKKQICFMPRKHSDEAEAVFGWLKCLGKLDGWELVPIDGCSERRSSELLKDATFFFAFGYPEGGTLPPFEALASGCKVIGYGGFASDELLTEAGGRLIPSGNTCQFAAIASILLTNVYTSVEDCHQRSKKVLDMFPMKGEEEQLIKFMREIINK